MYILGMSFYCLSLWFYLKYFKLCIKQVFFKVRYILIAELAHVYNSVFTVLFLKKLLTFLHFIKKLKEYILEKKLHIKKAVIQV